jgi:hypothetical protein
VPGQVAPGRAVPRQAPPDREPRVAALPLAAEAALATAAAGGIVAAAETFMPWVSASLRDRGADLLVTHRTGLELHPTGAAVLALGALSASLALLVILRPAVIRATGALPPLGVAIAVLAVTRRHAGDAAAAHLLRLRIGTVETERPTAVAAATHGLWLTVAAGLVIALVGAGYLAYLGAGRRHPRAVTAASRTASQAVPQSND